MLAAGSGRSEPALVHMRRFGELEPDSANKHTKLANVLLGSGDAEAGLRAVERALEQALRARTGRCGSARPWGE